MSEAVIRLAWGVAVNGILALAAYRAGSVNASGAWMGLILGSLITLALGWPGLSILAGFFVLASALTRLGYGRKEELGAAQEAGGARGAEHALANAGIPTVFALAAWITGDPFWAVAFCGAFATAAMDTAGSELGPLYGRRTISLKTARPVPPGTPGAVSLEGTLGGMVAAAALGALGWLIGLTPSATVLISIMIGALAGNLYEGMAGARGLLPHAWLNATNTLVGGLVSAAIAAALGP